MDTAAYVDAAASAVGLAIDPAHRPAVIFHVQLAAAMAARLDGLALGPEDESANVFRPVAPLQPATVESAGGVVGTAADAAGTGTR
jgi:hypothetical protein